MLKCEVGDNFRKSRIPADCDFTDGGYLVEIKPECSESLNQATRKTFQRCGFFDPNVKAVKMCAGHYELLGSKWSKHTTKYTCMCRDHDIWSRIARSKKKDGRGITLQQSKDLWTYFNRELIPVDGFICTTCRLKLVELIDGAKAKENKARQEEAIKRMEAVADKLEQATTSKGVTGIESMDFQDSEPLSIEGNDKDDDFTLSQNTELQMKREKLNEMFKLDGLNIRCESSLQHRIELNDSFRPVNKSDKTSYYTAIQLLANGLTSVIHTVVADRSQDFQFYQALIHSKAMAKLLDGPAVPNRLLTEVIR